MKIAATAANESWKPASIDEVRVPRKQRDRPEQQRLPRVAHSPGQPGERSECARDACANHRRLWPDGEDVGADRRERAELACPAPDPEEPREREHARGDEHHVLARDGEDVVQPGSAEVLPQATREGCVVAEDDPVEDRAPFSRQPGRDRALEPRADAIGEPTKPAACTDLVPRVQPEHHVHAVAAQPRALIEPVGRPEWLAHEGERIQDRALRRRTPEWKLQLYRFVDRSSREAAHASLGAHDELRLPRRRGDDDDCVPCPADVGRERADVECVEPGARPPPSERDEDESGAGEAQRRRFDRGEGRCREQRAAQRDGVHAADVRKRQPEAERRRQNVCGHPHPGHGTTSPRRLSMRAGPIPGIASSSSTEVNGPCACR